MTKEQIANLHIGDEIWFAKFRIGYDERTRRISALVNQSPIKYIIRNYLYDDNNTVVGFLVKDSRVNFVFHIFVDNLIDYGITSNIKYATNEKEITEWYENHKREQKAEYLKQLEEATKTLEEI